MSVSRHMLQLFAGVPGGRKWRRVLGTAAARSQANLPLVYEYLEEYRERFSLSA